MGSSKACGRKRKPDLEVLELFGLDDYSAKRMNLSKVHYKFTTVWYTSQWRHPSSYNPTSTSSPHSRPELSRVGWGLPRRSC